MEQIRLIRLLIGPSIMFFYHIRRVLPTLEQHSGAGGSLHIDSRILSSHRAFFSLQGAGLRYDGVSPGTALEIYRAGVLSVLTYGCSAIHLTKKNIQVLENQRCKLLKCILGIGKRTHNTPTLSAIKMDPMNIHIQKSALNVFKSSLICNSKAQKVLFIFDRQKP